MHAALKNSETDCWMQTYSGAVFYPLAPTPESIRIVDIAGSLSKMCRFAGHCNRFYSVAEHSVHVASMVDQKHRLTALLHDASEAYLVDIPRPIKPQLANYKKIEERLMEVIAEKFNIAWPLPEQVKLVDNAILSDERDQNMAFMDVEPKLWGNVLPPLNIELEFWSPDTAFSKFMGAFFRYGGVA